MKSKDYKYNENLISSLAYKEIVEKYSLSKENINHAIYYAVTSLDTHIDALSKIEDSEENILLGDYYSFEYYNLLQGNLELLNKISSHMAEVYKYLQTGTISKEHLYHIIFNLHLILLSEYGMKLDDEDIINILESYEKTYHTKLKSIVEIDFNKVEILEKARAMNDRKI